MKYRIQCEEHSNMSQYSPQVRMWFKWYEIRVANTRINSKGEDNRQVWVDRVKTFSCDKMSDALYLIMLHKKRTDKIHLEVITKTFEAVE